MVNKVILVGNLGKDPEIKTFSQGTKLATFSVATSESYKDKNGQKVTNTEWHNVNAWRGLAEIAEKYLRKGMTVYIEGKIRTRSYDDKDGNTRYATSIDADNMTMLGGKQGDRQEHHEQPAQSKPAPHQNDLDDDFDGLPF